MPKPKFTKLDWKVGVPAVISIAGLEAYALVLGHDGYLFTFAVAAIAGIAGFTIRRFV